MAEQAPKKTMDQILQQLQGIFSPEENTFIRLALGGKAEIFTLLRNFFLQAPLTEQEQAALKEFSGPKWIDILKRMYFPEMNFTRPLGQVRDLWTFMKTNERTPDEASIEIEARQILIDYLTERFATLAGEELVGPKLVDLVPSRHKPAQQNLIDLTARNMIMAGVDGSTGQLLAIANTPEETEEEAKKRMKKDSSK